MENVTMILPKMPADSFDWIRWRDGILIWNELGISCRYRSMIDGKNTLKKHAVGYLEGRHLFCRPKQDEYAILFLIGETFRWTHFRKKEFHEIFS